MALIGNNADTLLNGLSSFWHRFFRDLKDIQAAYEGAEIQLGQVYLNFMSDVLNTSVVEAPLFRKEFYKLITIREDQIVYRQSGTNLGSLPPPTFYGNPGTDRYVYTSDTFFNRLPQLQDAIFAPKASLEDGADYRTAGAEIQFEVDPTDPILPGYAHRRVVIAIGGKFTSATENWISAGVQKGDTLYYSERINLNPLTVPPADQESVGFLAWLALQNEARKATIVHVTADKLSVSIDTPFPTFPAGQVPAFSWRIMRQRDDGIYDVTLPRSPTPVAIPPVQAPFTDGTIEYTSTLEVSELAFWAVDARIDDLTLYKTYGYFFTNPQLSSESYRALVRGLMQLYILGPSMARLESALNLTAGLSTVREEGEILSTYDSGILDEGVTGEIVLGDVFKAPASVFSEASVGSYIKISASNFAENVGTFNILAYQSPTQVRLAPNPTLIPDTGVTWLYTRTKEQTVTTNRNVYTFPLETPLRSDVKDTDNYNILTFKAFEALTTAIRVTDYVQDPEWWHQITIPAELLPDFDATRRVVTSQLYPNILGLTGDALVGDPGFYVGRDEESGNIAEGTTGTLTAGNFFEVTDDTFDASATEGSIQIYEAANPANVGIFKISNYVNPKKVVLIPAAPFVPETLLRWGYFKGYVTAAPYRHSSAFILMDRFLKLHMFAVLVDSSVSLTGLLVTDLVKIMRDVKPVHTLAYFRPKTEFKDIINLVDASFLAKMLRRQYEEITALENDLLIGSAWIIGDTWQFTNPVGGVITTGGPAGVFVAIGGADPSIQPADPTNIPPVSLPDLGWFDRALHVYTHP